MKEANNDKERLEDIKNSYLEGVHRLFGTPWVSIPKENFDWLIERAERVQKLEIRLENVMDRHTYLEGDYYDLQKQNERYREALERIARINIEQGTVTISEVQAVLLARKALEESE